MIHIFYLAAITLVIVMTLCVISRYEDALTQISHSHTDNADELRDIADAARHPRNPMSPRVSRER